MRGKIRIQHIKRDIDDSFAVFAPFQKPQKLRVRLATVNKTEQRFVPLDLNQIEQMSRNHHRHKTS
jgi:hypothetical protein